MILGCFYVKAILSWGWHSIAVCTKVRMEVNFTFSWGYYFELVQFNSLNMPWTLDWNLGFVHRSRFLRESNGSKVIKSWINIRLSCTFLLDKQMYQLKRIQKFCCKLEEWYAKFWNFSFRAFFSFFRLCLVKMYFNLQSDPLIFIVGYRQTLGPSPVQT